MMFQLGRWKRPMFGTRWQHEWLGNLSVQYWFSDCHCRKMWEGGERERTAAGDEMSALGYGIEGKGDALPVELSGCNVTSIKIG